MASRIADGSDARRASAGQGWRTLANARFELLLLVLLLATLAAVKFQDRILQQSITLTPQSVEAYSRWSHGDADPGLNGTSTERELAPLHWTCELRTGFDYPFCSHEIFFGKDRGTEGLNLSNFRSLTVKLLYRGPSKSFRLHLKNFDPAYAERTTDDSPKFNRVEFPTTPGREQIVEFSLDDFGVADWWLRKHEVSPKLSHPQFNNVTSLDIQTGTEPALGHHEFEVREIVIHKVLMTDAQWYLSLLGAWVVLIGAYLVYRLRNMKGELARRQALEALALHQAQAAEAAAREDHLTKVLNRRGILERFDAIVGEASDSTAIAVILIDIDQFKSLNDSFGHSYGDEVLSNIASLIRRNVRPGDAVGRWGGEEFVAILPGVDSLEAQHIAEKIRRRIEHFHFGECEKVTASLGIHWSPAPGPDLNQLVAYADVALYSAKRGGRNCCRLYRPGMAKAA